MLARLARRRGVLARLADVLAGLFGVLLRVLGHDWRPLVIGAQ